MPTSKITIIINIYLKMLSVKAFNEFLIRLHIHFPHLTYFLSFNAILSFLLCGNKDYIRLWRTRPIFCVVTNYVLSSPLTIHPKSAKSCSHASTALVAIAYKSPMRLFLLSTTSPVMIALAVPSPENLGVPPASRVILIMDPFFA